MIFVIGGVTASGKSDLAFRFAKAVNGVVINADAFAFYKEMEIGTAKPSLDELSSVETYLFNHVSLRENYSIYDYQKDARAIIEKFKVSNRPLIFVGGSGLYLRAVLYDYKLSKEKIRAPIDDQTISNIELYNELSICDKESALKIHPNNRKRILRALAIARSQDTLKSESDRNTSKEPIIPHVMVTLDRDNSELHHRIELRTRMMFDKGLRQEVTNLLKAFPASSQGLQAIGYKEFYQQSNKSDEELIELISLRTRQYAKRQRTFFRNQFDSKWFYNNEEAFMYLMEKYEELK